MRRIGARAVAAGLIVVVGASVGSAAGADGPTGGDGGGGQFQVGDSGQVVLSEEVPDFSGGNGPPPGYDLDLIYGLSPEGTNYDNLNACWGITLAAPGEGRPFDEVAQQQQEFDDPALYGACPIEDTFNLQQYILQTWTQLIQPPPPTPIQVNEGFGSVPGLAAYLEIGGDPHPTEVIPNPIGPAITITMTPRYEISWGDGTPAFSTESQGGPYPSGDLTHTYQDAGGFEVTVEAYWRATWSAGALGDDLPELAIPTVGGVDVAVDEHQARIDPG